MFTKGEVPIVLSYVTSPAYHLEHEKTDRFKSAIFNHGHYRQVEFAGIIKGTKNYNLAASFIDYMLSQDFQNAIPLNNWMYPVVRYGKLPESFKISPEPDVSKALKPSLVNEQNKVWLKAWARTMSE